VVLSLSLSVLPKLTTEPLPRIMAGGLGGGAGRSNLSEDRK
jgi:hypothetical protein